MLVSPLAHLPIAMTQMHACRLARPGGAGPERVASLLQIRRTAEYVKAGRAPAVLEY